MPNKTVCTDAIRDVVRSSGRRKYDVVVVRDGEVLVFPLPKRGEDFERAPAGPSLDELRQEVQWCSHHPVGIDGYALLSSNGCITWRRSNAGDAVIDRVGR